MKPLRPTQEAVLICEKSSVKQKIARETIRKMLHGKPPSIKNAYNLSLMYLEKNELSKGAKLLKNASILAPYNAELYNALCFAYAMEEKYDMAKNACEKISTLASEDEKIHLLEIFKNLVNKNQPQWHK